MKLLFATLLAFCLSVAVFAADKKDEDKKKEDDKSMMKTETFSGLAFRNIGPALASGRVIDLAIHPKTRSTYYVAVAAGGVWKTTNNGATWTPIFDGEGSYSIGCISIDSREPLNVWVGSGENNSQRSVGFGDGVYKSTDGGSTWENMGLKESEHIGKILIDPRDSNVVYVAAQGPLWNDGGDRGLYKTTDGGKTWKKSLDISNKTGVSDAWFDPRNPDVIFATSYQRRRHVWTLINGGPESTIYKTTDAGANWKKAETGLPKVDKGRIGLAVSPVNPDVVYAVVEAANKEGGFFRSTNSGSSWEKQSDYVPGGPQYYNELFPDPKDVDKVYSMDVFMQVTEDAGKTFKKAGEAWKHVDNHALWINPDNTQNLLNGNDGGVYESFDGGKTWLFAANLPITQFYRVAIDNDQPFYNVYGGTQDNNTLAGPSRNISDHGITNRDWYVTVAGDGFEPAIDPEDPNIIYSQSQHAGIVRYDRKTGEKIDIQPQPGKGEDAFKWNWDTPIIISPHSRTRLYMAAQKVFRSDDRGDTWKLISPDLTRQLDRNKMKVMGRVWSVDAVAKNASTSFYGNIVALSESPLKENLIYAGTDDGVIQVTQDAANWKKIDKISGVPELSYVSDVEASKHDASTVYASFNNHKQGDFKPYLMKSTDNGNSWNSIAGNLPQRGPVWTVAEDHQNKNLLFAGTEFGVFFTTDGGRKWIQLKGNMPVIAVRDIEIHKRENDLVLATFGRGFVILDDYSPLRQISESTLNESAVMFPVRKAHMYIPSVELGFPGKGFQGESYFSAPNPPFGAVFTYYLKDEIRSKRKERLEAEKKAAEKGEDTPYPSWEELLAEDREEDPAILLIVTDEEGNIVRRIVGNTKKGFQRVAWDLRYPAFDPTQLQPPADLAPWETPPQGPMAAPGTYKVQLAKRVDGKLEMIGQPQTFTAETIGSASLPEPDRKELLAFQKKTGRLLRAVLGAQKSAGEAQDRIKHLKKAIDDTPGANPSLRDEARALELKLADLNVALSGDTTRRRRNEAVLPSISDRVQQIVYGHWGTTSAPTQTHRQQYDIAASEFATLLAELRKVVETDLKNIEAKAEAAGAPWTPGRVPTWNPE